MSESFKSVNKGRVVCTIVETNYEYKADAKSMFDERIKGGFVKSEFKNPMFLVRVEEKDDDGNVVSTTNLGVDGFDVYKYFYTKEDERKESSAYKVMEKLLASDNHGVGTRVIFSSASLGENSYYRDGMLVQSITVDKGSYIESDAEKTAKAKDVAVFGLTGVFGDIEQQTDGSLKVDFYFAKKADGTLAELKGLVVDADVADDFLQFFRKDDRAEIQIQAVDVMHGTVEEESTSKAVFGKKNDNLKRGWMGTDFKITYAEVIDDPDSDKYLDEEVFDKGMELRKAELKAKKQKSEEKANNASSTSSSKGLGQKKEFLDAIPDDEEDNPFA
jgi:hypothetical protein